MSLYSLIDFYKFASYNSRREEIAALGIAFSCICINFVRISILLERIMTKILVYIVALFPFLSCADSNGSLPEQDDAVPTIIFDTDICSSTDDLIALRALYNYMDEGKCRLIGVIVDREGERNAACADIFNTFYGHPDIPIGLVKEGIKDAIVWNDYSGITEWKDRNGNVLFSRTVEDYSSLPDGYILYQRLLSSAPDKSVNIVSVGFVTALAQLLESETGRQLVADKVNAIYMMGAKFVPGEGDYNFIQGPEFAQTFFRLLPDDTPVYFSPSEVGERVYYSSDMVLEDMRNVSGDPLKEIYLRSAPDETQKMWDVLAVIHAVEGDGLFTLSEWGNVTIDGNGCTTFTPSPSGNCRYQMPGDEEWNAVMLEKIRKIVRK